MLNKWFLHAKGGINKGFFIATEADLILTQEGSLLTEGGDTICNEEVTPVELTIEDLQLLT